jgi:hypothetical protein
VLPVLVPLEAVVVPDEVPLSLLPHACCNIKLLPITTNR